MATRIQDDTALKVVADKFVYVSPEGQSFSASLDELLRWAQEEFVEVTSGMLPAGVRCAFRRGHQTIWVGEFPPTMLPVDWIAANSPVPFGSETKYDKRCIALPYVIVIGVFENGTLTSSNECFFRVAPLKSHDDELLYPSLLNISRIRPPNGKPLAWICTQNLNRRLIDRESDREKRMELGWRLLCQTLFDDAFNLSSEHHEGSSWYSESRGVDKRIATIEQWEENSRQNPLFVLEVPYLTTGFKLIEVVERIFTNLGNPLHTPTVADVIRLIVNHHSSRPKKPR